MNIRKKAIELNRNLGERGIGLIEVLAALAISVIAITSLVSLSLYTMRSSLNSKLTLEASKIAEREMELVRVLRDRSTTWAGFTTAVSGCTSYPCSMSLPPETLAVTATSSTTTYDNQEITRFFHATPNYNGDSNVVYVSVSVTWNVGGVPKETHLYTYLTNWRNE